MSVIQRTFRALVQIEAPPEKTARAFSLGVFLGFSPFLGLHMVLGLAFALIFRLNKLAVFIGLYMNNPWLVVPFYAFATWVGIQITGLPEGIEFPSIGFTELLTREFWVWLSHQWRLLIPAFVGSSVLSIGLGALAYPVSLFVLRRFHVHPDESHGGDHSEDATL